MTDNLIIVTLLWERDGTAHRHRLVRQTGATTKPEDVPLPHSVRLNCAERLILGRRLPDTDASERRHGKNDIVIVCTLTGRSDTEVWDPRPRTGALVNQQSYTVCAPRAVADTVAREYLERCLYLEIPMIGVYPCREPAAWMFEVAAGRPSAADDFNFARAHLLEVARAHHAEIVFGNSAVYYA